MPGESPVLLIPARAAGAGPEALPADYQRILTIVRDAAGPVTSGPSARRSACQPRCGASWSYCTGR
ncbi:hypothetical protein [Catenulispora rubra]|uniref:hypothetical protein n=1 Tax=Catenulispora rubra TaxID=280293 RepID=UPI001E4467D5|nr:hypothetical protein [Catenulispora rubra]